MPLTAGRASSCIHAGVREEFPGGHPGMAQSTQLSETGETGCWVEAMGPGSEVRGGCMLALCRGPAGNPVLPLWAACREPHSPTVGVGACREPRPLFPQVRLWLAQSTRAARAGEGLVLEDDPADKAETGSASGSESVLTSATLPPTPSPAAETRGAEPGHGDTPA